MTLSEPPPKDMELRARWYVLALCAVVTVLRAPHLVFEPRLWAEEANVHLAYAYSHGFIENLFLIPTSSGPIGYLQLPANLAAALAGHVLPLELAPVGTMATAFLIQLLPIVLVLWGRSHFWSTPGRRIACCAVLLLAPPMRPSVWLSTINSQVFCGIAAFVLLCEDPRRAGQRRLLIYRGLLAFCALSGAYTAMLAPAFFLRARLERCRETAAHFFIVAGAAVLQLAAYWATVTSALVAPERFETPDWHAASTVVLVQQLLQPVLGGPLADLLDRSIPEAVLQSGVASVSSVAAVAAFFVWIAYRSGRRLLLFPVSFAAVAGGTALLAYDLPRQRYAVVPGMLVILALLVTSWSPRPGSRRLVARALVALSLAAGVLTYRSDEFVDHKTGSYGHFSYSKEGRPDWRQEVEQWRRDPRHGLEVWPYTGQVSWATYLARREDFRSAEAALESVESFHLVTAGKTAERRIALDGVPAYFRLVVRGRSESPPRDVLLQVALLDAEGDTLAVHRIRHFRAGEPFREFFDSSLLRLTSGRDLLETRFVALRAESRKEKPVVVVIDRIEIVPSIQGLLEGLWPRRTLPTRLYHASPERPLAREATPILAVESLVRDGDLVYAAGDAARAGERWRRGPLGLALRPDSTYDEAVAYVLVAAPFFAAGGPAGAVVLNAGLLLLMAALAWRDLRRQGCRGVSFAVGMLFASAGLGFVFLPQPQVFEMFCLYVPLRWWIRGDLTEPEKRLSRGLAAGALLAAAIVQEPAWAVLAVACLADLLASRHRRAALALAAPAIVGVLAFGLAAGALSRGPVPGQDPTVAETAPERYRQPEDDGEARRPATPVALALDMWRLYSARNGWLAGFPFIVPALVLFFRRAEHRSRYVLFAALAVLMVWLASRGAEVALRSPLGSPGFAALAPLFLLLNDEAPAWPWQVLAWLAALVLTLGLVASVWNPIGGY